MTQRRYIRLKKFSLTLFSFLLLCMPAHAAKVSVDNIFVENGQYSADFYSQINRNFAQLENGNNNVTDDQITSDALKERSFADESNPRVRTYEGAACEKVYSGYLPTTSASLTTATSAGVAYPRGFRCVNSAGVDNTYTASRWTYVDLDQNCDLRYTEVNIGAAEPAVYTNSIRLARVSTDATTVAAITDMRKDSCATGPLEDIADKSTGASLEDMFSTGAVVRRISPTGVAQDGWASGSFVSYDAVNSFIVSKGSLYINGEYRVNSVDLVVPTTSANTLTGLSGIDAGAISASKRYYVYAAADEVGVKTYSVIFSESASAPTGATNYRKIGTIRTDGTSLFTSTDVTTAHALGPRDNVWAWASIDGSIATASIDTAYNVSAVTDNGAGDYTVTLGRGLFSDSFVALCTAGSTNSAHFCQTDLVGSTGFKVRVAATTTNVADDGPVSVAVFGEAME